MADDPAAVADPSEGTVDLERLRPPALAERLDRLLRHPALVFGAGLLGFFVAIAVYAIAVSGSGLTRLPFSAAFFNEPFPGPSAAHPFGVVGVVGVDLYQGLLQGTPIDLALLAGTIVPALLVGLVVGGYSGLVGGAVDAAVTGVSDILIGVPPFFLVLVIFIGAHIFVAPDYYPVVFVLAFVFVLWPYYARSVSARAHVVARDGYVEAARASGAGGPRLLRAHILPNAFFPVLAQVPVDVYNVFFVLTTFTFIGCYTGGASLTPFPTTAYPEWGHLLGQGFCYGFNLADPFMNWWMVLIPLATIVLFGLGVMLVCDGVEQLLGARSRT